MSLNPRIVTSILYAITLFLLAVFGCGRSSATDTIQSPVELQTAEPAQGPRQTMKVGPSPSNVDIVLVNDTVTLSWFSLNPGDYNVDGTVSGMDLFPLAANFNRAADEEPGLECIDGNGDNTLNGMDLCLISVNFQNRIDGVNVYAASTQTGPFEDPPQNGALIAYEGCGAAQDIDLTVDPAEPIWFALKSYDDLEGAYSPLSDSVRPPVTPVVNGLTWRGNDSEIELGWLPWADPYGDFKDWQVQLRERPAGPWMNWYSNYHINSGDPVYGLVICPCGSLTNGTRYDLRVKGTTTDLLEGDWTEVLDAGCSANPAAPTNVAATGFSDSIRIAWDASVDPDRTGYNIYRAETTGGPYERVSVLPFERVPATYQSTAGGSHFWDDMSVVSGTDYYYVITTVNTSRVESVYSAEVFAATSNAPSAPTGLYGLNNDELVRLYWDANPEPDIETYQVLGSTSSGPPYEIEHLTPNLQIEVPDLTNETTYYFCLRAKNTSQLWSDYSEELSMHPSAPPAMPTVLAGVGRYLDTEVYLTWNPVPGSDLGGLDIRRSLTPGGPSWDQVAYLVPDDTAWTMENADRGQTYYFKMRTIDTWGVPSDFTAEIEVITPGWQWEVVDPGGHVGEYSDITIDHSGNPQIAYLDADNNKPKWAWWTGSAWNIETVLTPDSGGRGASIEIAASGWPSIAYLNTTDSSLECARSNGMGGWDIDVVDSTGAFREYTSQAITSDNHQAIAYIYPNTGDVRYAYHVGGSGWTTEVATTAVSGPMEPSLAFDPDDNPAISFMGWSDETLNLVWFDGSDWNLEVVDSGEGKGRHSCLAFDSHDQPVIAHGNGALHLAWFNGVSWDLTVVDDRDQGRYPSLVLENGERPIISYRYGGTNNLNVAWWNEDSWVIEEIETIGSDEYTSIALDWQGYPVISHSVYHSGPRSLAVAWFK